MLLPTEKSEFKPLTEPRSLFIIGPPKLGKSTACSALEGALIMDLEDKYGAIASVIKVVPKTIEDLKSMRAQAIDFKKVTGKKTYEFCIVDTIDKIDSLANLMGTRLYMESLQGRNYNRFTKEIIAKYKYQKFVENGKIVEGKTPIPENFPEYQLVTKKPKGSGYQWQRDAFKIIVSWLEELSDKMIYVGHIREKLLDKDGVEKSVRTSNLTGQLGPILAADCDAIAIAKRVSNKFILDFNVNSDTAGTLLPHLEGKKVTISTKDKKSGNISISWKLIYPDQKDITIDVKEIESSEE